VRGAARQPRLDIAQVLRVETPAALGEQAMRESTAFAMVPAQASRHAVMMSTCDTSKASRPRSSKVLKETVFVRLFVSKWE
jgi:hypothetical protein